MRNVNLANGDVLSGTTLLAQVPTLLLWKNLSRLSKQPFQ